MERAEGAVRGADIGWPGRWLSMIVSYGMSGLRRRARYVSPVHGCCSYAWLSLRLRRPGLVGFGE